MTAMCSAASQAWRLGAGIAALAVVVTGVVRAFAGEPPPAAPPAVEVLEQSWNTTEVWSTIQKTKYIWRARLRNHTDQALRVSVYFVLADRDGIPLDRNTTTEVIAAGATVEVTSDSYLDNQLVARSHAGQVSVKWKAAGGGRQTSPR